MKKLLLSIVLFISLFDGCKSQDYIAYVHTVQYGGYGMLYNWFCVTDIRKISSSDEWVVPSRTNFITMGAYLGGNSVAGGKLKETGTTYWNTPNTGATNETGFNGKGAGGRIGTSGLFGNNLEYLIMQNTYPDGAQQCGIRWDSSTLFYTMTLSGAYKSGYSIRLLYTGSGTPTTYTGNDGTVYPVVLIGTQRWLAMNLKETKWRDGTDIPNVTDNTAWSVLTSAACCDINNDPTLR